MRCRVKMENMQGITIPVDYHYPMYSYVYMAIGEGEPALATEIHNMQGYKPYSFSEIDNPGHVIGKNNLQLHNDVGSFIFTSHREDVMEAFVAGALKYGYVEIQKKRFPILEIKILKEPEFKNKMRFKTLSPIVISASREDTERGINKDLYPTDEEWYMFFNKNMKKKYFQFFGVEREEDLEIKVLSARPKKYHVPGPATGFKMTFEISGDIELIKLGYQSGFGRRTAQGFGCVAVV